MALAPPSQPGIVRMTNDDTGGEEYVTRTAYRSVWWDEGWRSVDDPDYEGDPSIPSNPAYVAYVAAQIEAIPAGADDDVFALRKLGTGPTDAAAGNHNHDGVYEPVGNEIWLPPNVGGPSSTVAPTLEPISLLGAWDGEERWPCRWFDPDTVQSWSWAPIRFPTWWESFDFLTHWVKTSASGDVVLRGDYTHRTPGTGQDIKTTSNGVVGTPVTLTAPVGFLEQTVILLEDIPITAGEVYMVRVSRLASDVADTLTSKFPLLDGLLRQHV